MDEVAEDLAIDNLERLMCRYSRYQIVSHPARLPPPEPNLTWLSSQKRPHYPKSENESVQCNPLSFFQSEHRQFTADLASSLRDANTSIPRGLDCCSTTTYKPLTQHIGSSIAQFGNTSWRTRSVSYRSHSLGGYSASVTYQYSGIDHSLFFDDVERQRRQQRLRYRKHRKERTGMFPWQRKKTPRVLEVEKFAARGRLGWLVDEIATMEDETGGDGAGWQIACRLVTAGFWV